MSTASRIEIAKPSLGDDEWNALRSPLEIGWLTQGPKVLEFETKFADLHDVPHAIATTSCTTALHLALVAMGVQAGDEVIVPAFTWVSTANVVLYCGATPVFCDVDPATNNLKVEDVAALVTERTKAVVAVHLFGLCVDMDSLRTALPDPVMILEDAACAAGARYRGRSAGGLGDMAAFSFHPRKTITTGEGGMLSTCNDALAETARTLRNHGASISEEQRHAGPQPYILPEFDVLGFNYRMTDLQGAVGCVQIDKLDGFITERAEWAAYYREHLGGLNWLKLPQEPEGGRHAWQAFVTCVDPTAAPRSRNDIMLYLQDLNISTRPGTHAVHMLGFYKDTYGIKTNDFPGAAYLDANTMALPLGNHMSKQDYDRVIAAILAL